MILAARLAFVACLAATLIMTGVIWFVQVVHYPLMARVGADTWRAYHADHTRTTGTVVFVPMVIELATAAWLALGSRPTGLGLGLAWLGFALTLLTWGITGLVSVPAHNRLALGFDAATHRWLVTSNVARTIAWTAHSVVLLFATYRLMEMPFVIIEDR